MIPLDCVISWLQLRKWNNFIATSNVSRNKAVLCQVQAAYTTWQTFVSFQGVNCGGHWLLRPWGRLLYMSSGGWQILEQPSPCCLTRRHKMSEVLYWLRLRVALPQCSCCTDTVQMQCSFCQSRPIFIPVFRFDISCLLRLCVLVSWQTAQYKQEQICVVVSDSLFGQHSINVALHPHTCKELSVCPIKVTPNLPGGQWSWGIVIAEKEQEKAYSASSTSDLHHTGLVENQWHWSQHYCTE